MSAPADMNKTLKTEEHIHGVAWARQHGGYFSSASKARPLVTAVTDAVRRARPDILADLGGGTGFLLSKFQKCSVCGGIGFVNVDISDRQLAQCRVPGVKCVNLPVGEIARTELCPARADRLMLVMRSLLHYCGGRTGWASFLRGARKLCRPGEYFVHQSACFDSPEDAALMNAIYRLMHTNKRYPHTAGLAALLEETGWSVEKVSDAPSMFFTSEEMRDRYALTGRDIGRILPVIMNNDGGCAKCSGADAFKARLEYHIFTCRAK